MAGYKKYDKESNYIGVELSMETYIKKFMHVYSGECGVAEQVMMLLSKENVLKLANMFKYLGFNIIRCESSNLENVRLQEKFLSIVDPDILAASQGHVFGINQKRLRKIKYLFFDHERIFQELKFWLNNFLNPFIRIKNWILAFIKVIIYLIKYIITIVFNIKYLVGK